MNALRVAWANRPCESDSNRVTASKKSDARSCANRLSHMKVRETNPLLRQSIQVRCLVSPGAVDSDVTISHVVRKDDDDIRFLWRVSGG